MPATDEFVPDSAVVDEVINIALLPVLNCCEEELGESLAAKVVILSGNIEGHPRIIHGLHRALDPVGTIRMIFRRTFRPNRYRFHVEAIYRGLSACKSGFSGFVVRGDVSIENEQIRVNTSGGVYRNNVWEWQGWDS